jgi:AcrR family transcriptional regulator
MPKSTTGAPFKPTSRGEQTRECALAAATELFAARGFAPITMRAIGDAAGIDNSSLYRHFASKSELAREVLDRAMRGLAAQLAPLTATTPATLDGVIEVVITGALHLWDRPDTARLVLHWVTSARDAATGFDVSLPIDAAGAPSGDFYRGIVDVIGRASRAGEIRAIASFLASQEPDRTDEDARLTWESEVRCLLRGMLAP